MKKLLLLLIPVVLLALVSYKGKDYELKGRVTDPQGKGIPYVTVEYNSGRPMTRTDDAGYFKFKVPNLNGTLTFSSIGFSAHKEQIKGRTEINVILSQVNYELEEVVVTAMGTQMKRLETAAAVSGKVQGIVANQSYNPGYVREYKSVDDMPRPDYNTEGYDGINENIFVKTTQRPLSTFSIDVDNASYSNVRRYLSMGRVPPEGSVRIEEMVNYFKYDYAEPTGEHPFSIHTEISDAPWNEKHKLVMVGLQGKRVPTENLPASNLVFLIDVSGSMMDYNKLPLVKSSMKLLVEQLRPQDKVSIVVYAGAAGLVLPPTSGNEKERIMQAVNSLQAGGSTAGGEGLKLAYKTARESFMKEGNNRVILCSDGDFNVGESSDAAMEKLIEQERESGVFLTVLGYGMGNYKDSKMQKLAQKGNGNHAYIDGISEAKKVLVNEFGGTFFTIAKDVKLQVEFNPALVAGYRLIGYENRMLANEDFKDDKKDAGDLGSGHTVTALYEIIPAGVESSFLRDVDPLKYQKGVEAIKKNSGSPNEWMTVKFRYKKPDGQKSTELEHVLDQKPVSLAKSSDNFRFAAAVAELGLLLRDSEFKGNASIEQVIELAKTARGRDDEGYRVEFIRLAENASSFMVKK